MKRALLLFLIPILIWVFLIQTRSIWFVPRCKETPALCSPHDLKWPDSSGLVLDNSLANQISFVTQNAAGALAGVLVLMFHLVRIRKKDVMPDAGVRSALSDLSVLMQVTLWNGVFLELARTFVQRPRPFVYKDPEGLGENIAHYTSFYSGHTSFAAAIILGAVLLLVRRHAGRGWIISALSAGSFLVFATALLRVLAGRHFISDVLAGFMAGIVVAGGVLWVQTQTKRQTAAIPHQAK